jgi:hydroxyacylglutathione hydrolase
MKVEQIYTGCIAHAAYYLESNGEAAIFDPLREVQPYIEKAKRDHAKIKYVFETHFHADFVSGHLDLATQTGANIVYGPTAKPQFEAIVATDNQEFTVGAYTVRAIHTPGHTMESTCYLLIDEKGKDYGLISGDTLFIGDVGRPDLAQHVISELTPELLASHLYDSLHTKILPLSDDLIVYPNHGAGSACGKNMSKETTDTLGNQKRTNYALNPKLTREQFIEKLLDGQRTPPAYFPENVLLNIKGYTAFDVVLKRGLNPLDIDAFELVANAEQPLLLDTRDPEVFATGFIPNSVNIGIDGNFAMWVGALVPGVKQPILLITENGREEETITRLARIGFDNVLGYLNGGFESWKLAGKQIDKANRISAQEFAQQYNQKPMVIDVRNESEFEAEHVVGAINIPLDYLNYNLSSIPKDKPFVIHCAGGYRSMIASSILKSRGWEQFVDVQGGFSAIAQTSVPKTAFVCQSKAV